MAKTKKTEQMLDFAPPPPDGKLQKRDPRQSPSPKAESPNARESLGQLYVPMPKLHALKQWCVRNGKTMRDVADEMLTEFLQSHGIAVEERDA